MKIIVILHINEILIREWNKNKKEKDGKEEGISGYQFSVTLLLATLHVTLHVTLESTVLDEHVLLH